MKRTDIAKELIAAAREISGMESSRKASRKGPISEVLWRRARDSNWNAINNLEDELRDAAHEYDVAASYSGYPGERDAKDVMDSINRVRKMLKILASRELSKIVDKEQAFIKKYGTPEEYADRTRREIFPI